MGCPAFYAITGRGVEVASGSSKGAAVCQSGADFLRGYAGRASRGMNGCQVLQTELEPRGVPWAGKVANVRPVKVKSLCIVLKSFGQRSEPASASVYYISK